MKNYKAKLTRMLPFLLSFAILAFIYIYLLLAVGINTEVDIKSLVLDTVVKLVILVFMYAVWLPSGKISVKQNQASDYFSNIEAYGVIVDRIDAEKQNILLQKYCEYRMAKKQKELGLELLKKKGLSAAQCLGYEKIIDGEKKAFRGLLELSKKEIKELVQRLPKIVQKIFIKLKKEFEIKPLTRSQARAIIKVKKGLKIEKITETVLMTDSEIKSQRSFGLRFNENEVSTRYALQKAASKIITAVMLAFVAFEPSGDIRSLAYWANALALTLAVVASALGGYRTGIKVIAQDKNDVIKRRIQFLKEFEIERSQVDLSEYSDPKDIGALEQYTAH